MNLARTCYLCQFYNEIQKGHDRLTQNKAELDGIEQTMPSLGILVYDHPAKRTIVILNPSKFNLQITEAISVPPLRGKAIQVYSEDLGFPM